jgi:hypothetical protein
MTLKPYYPTQTDPLPQVIAGLVETIPALRANVAALAAENAAMRRALQVLLAKVDNHPAADIPDGIVSCRYVPVTPGEAAVWRALACPSSVGVGGER